MAILRRRRRSKVVGSIIHDAAAEHRCHPPGSHNWPADEWKVDQPRKYPAGTIWRCDCGLAWEVTTSVSLGLWLNWVRAYEHDQEA